MCGGERGRERERGREVLIFTYPQGAFRYLRRKPNGTFLVRPSSKKGSHTSTHTHTHTRTRTHTRTNTFTHTPRSISSHFLSSSSLLSNSLSLSLSLLSPSPSLGYCISWVKRNATGKGLIEHQLIYEKVTGVCVCVSVCVCVYVC